MEESTYHIDHVEHVHIEEQQTYSGMYSKRIKSYKLIGAITNEKSYNIVYILAPETDEELDLWLWLGQWTYHC